MRNTDKTFYLRETIFYKQLFTQVVDIGKTHRIFTKDGKETEHLKSAIIRDSDK